MSHLVPGFLDPDQAGLEDFDVGLRVTSAHSCPNFPGFVLLDQQLPKRGLRVTSPPKPARKSQAQTPLGASARGTPAAADDPRHESPVNPSRDEDAPCAGTAQHHTPPSSSSGSLQPTDRGDTTSGRTDTVSANSSSLSPSTKRGRRSTVPPLRQLTPRQNSGTGGGSTLASRPGSLLQSASSWHQHHGRDAATQGGSLGLSGVGDLLGAWASDPEDHHEGFRGCGRTPLDFERDGHLHLQRPRRRERSEDVSLVSGGPSSRTNLRHRERNEPPARLARMEHSPSGSEVTASSMSMMSSPVARGCRAG